MRRLTDVDRRGVSSTAARKALRAVSIAALACLVSLAAAPAAACTGDCDGNGEVTISELMKRHQHRPRHRADEPSAPRSTPAATARSRSTSCSRGVKAALDGCPAPIINTIAGTGVAGLNDDGLSPLDTQLYLPQDTTFGPDGHLYFVDWNNHRIRRIKNGVVETFAGSGYLGDADGDDPKTIDFNHPTNVCFDHDGRHDRRRLAQQHGQEDRVLPTTGRHGHEPRRHRRARLRRRRGAGQRSQARPAQLGGGRHATATSSSPTRPTTACACSSRAASSHTICGTGTPGYSGDGGPAARRSSTAPRGSRRRRPSRIAIDDHNRIYIADTGNHRIRLIDEVGTITTIAGTGEPGYSGDGGPATAAQLDTPSDVAVGAERHALHRRHR